MWMYIAIVKASFGKSLAYRSEVWLQLVGIITTLLIQVSIWKAVIDKQIATEISLEEMITYSVLNILIFSVNSTQVISRKVHAGLRTGDISSDLIRPVPYYLNLHAYGTGWSLFQFIFAIIPTLGLSVIFFVVLLPYSYIHFLCFIISVFIGLFISFLIGYLMSLIAFWIMSLFSLEWIYSGVVTIFSGVFLPIWFFPEPLERVARLLPFQYLGYIPSAIYLGVIEKGELLSTLIYGGIWILILLLINWHLWGRAIKRLVIQGG